MKNDFRKVLAPGVEKVADIPVELKNRIECGDFTIASLARIPEGIALHKLSARFLNAHSKLMQIGAAFSEPTKGVATTLTNGLDFVAEVLRPVFGGPGRTPGVPTPGIR